MNADPIDFDFETPVAPSPQTVPPRHLRDSASTASVNINGSTMPELGELDTELSAFQSEKSGKVLMASAFSTALTTMLRREYLADPTIPMLMPNLNESLNENTIEWMKLVSVGLEPGFTAGKAAEVLECLFSAFHLPGNERLLFLVSGDKETGQVTIHLGLQAIHSVSHSSTSFVEVWNGFAKSNWPGLSFIADKDVSLGFSADSYKNAKPGKRPGVRILTGIPSGRNKETVAATIDKLSSALSGRTWRYLVIAEPVANAEISKIIQTCRELQGRAESLKSFQFGQSVNITSGDTTSTTNGGNETTTQRDISPGRVLGAVATGVALAYAAPLVLGAGAAAAAGGAAVGGNAAGLLFSLGLGGVLAGAKTRSSGTNWSKTIAHSLSEARGVSFSETVANKHAEAATKLLESHIERLLLCEAVGAWSVGAYFIGENEATADIGSHALKAILSGDNSHWEPIRIMKPLWKNGLSDKSLPLVALERFDNPNIVPMIGESVIHHQLGTLFDKLRTLINTREFVRMVNFPLSNIPGVPVCRIAADTGLRNIDSKEDKTKLVLGNQIYRGLELNKYPYSMPTALLAKHSLVCGINGSGKTNTILGILSKLLSVETPFLVIEPAKQEYVDWAVTSNLKLSEGKYHGDKEAARHDPQWISVYIPGRKKWNGEEIDELSINPFDFVWLNKDGTPKTLEHIDRLKTIINAALPMQESLPILMEELIFAVYGVPFSAANPGEKAPCWLPPDSRYRTPNFDERIPVPTFVQMANHLPRLFERLTYAKDVQRNLQAALKTRIESFKRGWRKPLLNKDLPRHSAEDWERLFGHPTVINLTSLTSDEDKAFFMAVILMFIYEYRQEVSELPATLAAKSQDSGLKHLLVIEEAHRVLGRSEGAVSAFAAAPKQKVSEMFSNMISEVRAYGQGILIADQIPSRLNEDAVKNTNLKIVHKLVSSDDRKSMATALNLWDDQERVIGDLNVGEALVRGDMDKEAYLVKVKKNS